jgi:Short C-terminal domain
MPGLIRGVARTAVIAGTATAVSNRVSRRQASRWAAQDAQTYQQEPANQQPQAMVVAEAAPVDDTTDKLAQLKQLGELKDQGVLTDEEFQAEKARILGH